MEVFYKTVECCSLLHMNINKFSLIQFIVEKEGEGIKKACLDIETIDNSPQF